MTLVLQEIVICFFSISTARTSYAYISILFHYAAIHMQRTIAAPQFYMSTQRSSMAIGIEELN